MLELKDFDCEGSYEYYLEHFKWRDEKMLRLDMPELWRDKVNKDRCFTKHKGIYYRYATIEHRLLNIEILLKRVLDAK